MHATIYYQISIACGVVATFDNFVSVNDILAREKVVVLLEIHGDVSKENPQIPGNNYRLIFLHCVLLVCCVSYPMDTAPRLQSWNIGIQKGSLRRLTEY